MSSPLDRLLAIMARLRDPASGCDWDLAQSFASIAPYTIEEAYEVADAIQRGAMDDLRGELGDLLLQVVFHARMAEEAGLFTFADVAREIADKMERRHPHIFARPATGAPRDGDAMNETRWEDQKAAERRNQGAASAMDLVALALPALMRAQKLQQRAARLGFDWPDPAGARAKIFEELAEFEEATCPNDQMEEAGDLLFAAVNFIRHHGLDAEQALRAANGKFENRFRLMEDLAMLDGRDFPALTLADQERYWQQAKQAGNQPSI